MKKVHWYSWILGVTALGLGCSLFVIIPLMRAGFDLGQVDMPVFTRAVLLPGGLGWLAISFVLAAGIIWKDILWPERPNWVNQACSAVLGMTVGSVLIAVFLPYIALIESLTE